jgi:hypothetical protein
VYDAVSGTRWPFEPVRERVAGSQLAERSEDAIRCRVPVEDIDHPQQPRGETWPSGKAVQPLQQRLVPTDALGHADQARREWVRQFGMEGQHAGDLVGQARELLGVELAREECRHQIRIEVEGRTRNLIHAPPPAR